MAPTSGSYSGNEVLDGFSCSPLHEVSPCTLVPRSCAILPRPLVTVRRNQDPASSQQIEAAVGDVVENGFRHGRRREAAGRSAPANTCEDGEIFARDAAEAVYKGASAVQ